MAQKNTSRVLRDQWFVRVGRVFAWTWAVFWALIGLVGLGELLTGRAENSTDVIMPFICLALAGLHIWLIVLIRRIHGLLQDFRLYCAVFAREPDKSIPDLAASLNLPEQAVMDRLQRMCRRGYFNGYIDYRLQRMIFDAPREQSQVVYCPGCGARSVISRQGAACPYCGAPLQL